MDAIKEFWKIKLAVAKKNLEKNNFKVSVFTSVEKAKDAVLKEIKDPALNVKTIASGGSTSLSQSKIIDEIKKLSHINYMDSSGLSPEQSIDVRRKSLLADYYLSSSNAVTMDGQLLNLDMIGNRVGAIHFGPKNVALIIGRNKLVNSLEDAKTRIRTYVAPMNSLRLKRGTPCNKTACCMDCSKEERICNVWTITEKCFPKGRVHIFLVNQDLGF